MVVLVTGAHGFLGRHISEHLRGEGHEVIGVGRPEMEVPSPALEALVTARPPSAVVHCATPASVPASIKRTAEDYAGSVTVLEALLALLSALARPPRVLFISSAAVYGEPQRLPIFEQDPLEPLSPYGRHRLLCEQLVSAYAEHYGEPSTSLRVFSAYGEGLRRQVLWEICRQALATGSVALTGTGEETRDFVHARDVATAVAVALARENAAAAVLNVASGKATTIRALAGELDLGSESVTFSGGARPGDPQSWQADLARIQALGWRPEVPLVTGVAQYAAWVRGVVAPQGLTLGPSRHG